MRERPTSLGVRAAFAQEQERSRSGSSATTRERVDASQPMSAYAASSTATPGGSRRTIRAGARAVSSCGSMPMKLRRAYRRRLRRPCGSGRRSGMDSSLPGPRAGTRGGTPWLLLALLGAVRPIEQIDAEGDLDRAVVRVRPAVWRVATSAAASASRISSHSMNDHPPAASSVARLDSEGAS